MLLLFLLDNVASERELMGVIRERMDYLWFLGYGLDEEVPNHSVLSTKARARWGRQVFCDLSQARCNNALRRVWWTARRCILTAAWYGPMPPKIRCGKPRRSCSFALRQAYAVEEGKLDEQPGTAVNATHLSPHGSEATLARSGSTTVLLSYKQHRMVDDAQGVITAAQTTTGKTGDAAQLAPLSWSSTQQHTGAQPKVVVGDKHYGSADNHRYCQSHGSPPHLPGGPRPT